MIKCLIFDCDGTLVDSEYLCNLGLQIMLKEYGVEVSAEVMMHKFRGGKLAEILKTLEEEHDISLNDNFVIEYREIVDQLFEKNLQPFEGVTEFLDQNTLPVCVASSGPIRKIKRSLQLTGLTRYFGDNLFSSYEINSWKPAPDLFLYAAEQMGFQPSECLVIEDSMLGIQAGLAAGMKTVLFDPMKMFDQKVGITRIRNMSELAYNID